jgi:hypothetical protein
MRVGYRLCALAFGLAFLLCSAAGSEAGNKVKSTAVDLGGQLAEEMDVKKVSAEGSENRTDAKRQVAVINSATSDVEEQRIANQYIASRQEFIPEKRTDGPEQVRNSTATNQTSDNVDWDWDRDWDWGNISDFFSGYWDDYWGDFDDDWDDGNYTDDEWADIDENSTDYYYNQYEALFRALDSDKGTLLCYLRSILPRLQ